MPYSDDTKKLLEYIGQGELVFEEDFWIFIFRMLNGRSTSILLTDEKLADFLPTAHLSAIAFVIEEYEHALVWERYVNFSDAKFGNSDLQKCPITGHDIKPIDVHISVIDALDLVWTENFGQKWVEQRVPRKIPLYERMMGRIMRMMLHLEWAGYGTSIHFEVYWKQILEYPREENGYPSPFAPSILKEFLTPRLFDSQEQVTLPIYNFLPIEMKRRLYTEAWEFYTTSLDPGHYGDVKISKVNPKRLLAELVCKTEADLFDDEFKKPFQECYLG